MASSPVVTAPQELGPLFERAEEYVRRYFSEQRSNPASGVLDVRGERYIQVRAASISIEFFDLVEQIYRGETGGGDVARSLLFDVAHAIGLADARDFHEEMGLTDPLEKLSAGPVHFAFTGWAVVDIHPESRPTADDDFVLIYDHRNSFEAEAWLDQERTSDTPVCVMNAGYSSGWCEASFDRELVAREVLCRARGDADCRFVMAPRHRIDDQVRRYLEPRGLWREDHVGPRNWGFLEKLRQREHDFAHAQRMEAIGLLAGGLAHDFNNLLTVILGCADQLSRTLPEGSPEFQSAEAILAASERAGVLTRQLLGLARQERLDLRSVNLGAVVRGLRPIIDNLLPDTIVLDVSLLPVMAVRAEPGQLEQVIVNLVANGRDAMPLGGTLEILASSEPGWWVLEVRDTGPGLDPVNQSRLFEPFFSTKPTSSGLGLSTARSIARHFQGDLELHNGALGAVARLRLPASQGPVSEPVASGGVERGSGRVLVIDDDDGIRQMLERFLPERGFQVRVAASLAEAVAQVEADPGIDLVLCDVVMPGGAGPQVAAELAKHIPAVPFVFMTGYADRGLSLPPGAPVLRKPFSLDGVVRQLNALLDAPER